MFVIIGHQVIEGEAIVTRDEIDSVNRYMPCRLVEIRASCNARGDLAYHPWITPDKAADIIAVAPVPFGPTITREAADLIEASGIPRLSNQFGISEHLI